MISTPKMLSRVAFLCLLAGTSLAGEEDTEKRFGIDQTDNFDYRNSQDCKPVEPKKAVHGLLATEFKWKLKGTDIKRILIPADTPVQILRFDYTWRGNPVYKEVWVHANAKNGMCSTFKVPSTSIKVSADDKKLLESRYDKFDKPLVESPGVAEGTHKKKEFGTNSDGHAGFLSRPSSANRSTPEPSRSKGVEEPRSSVSSKQGPETPAKPSPGSKPKSGCGWMWWIIIPLILGAIGFTVYWFVLRPQTSDEEEEDALDAEAGLDA
jgi:hypothetical protein